jgi:SAM-dependent methyltransferase
MINYLKLSEYPNLKVPSEQIERIEERYSFGSSKCNGLSVLEIGCGTGIGAKILSDNSKYYVGCDIDYESIKIAKKNNPQLNFFNCNAENINKKVKKKFDVIIIFESSYYLKDIEKVFFNLRKIMHNGALIIMSTPNKNLKSFTAGKYTYEYDDQESIKNKFSNTGFKLIESYASFSVNEIGFLQKIMQPLKFIATKLNLIPYKMKNKEFLKKIYYGGNFKVLPKSVKLKKNYKKNMKSIFNKSLDKEHKILYFIGKKITKLALK